MSKSKMITAEEIKCEFKAVSPKGNIHCIHDDCKKWMDAGSCNASSCPVNKFDVEKSH